MAEPSTSRTRRGALVASERPVGARHGIRSWCHGVRSWRARLVDPQETLLDGRRKTIGLPRLVLIRLTSFLGCAAILPRLSPPLRPLSCRRRREVCISRQYGNSLGVSVTITTAIRQSPVIGIRAVPHPYKGSTLVIGRGEATREDERCWYRSTRRT